MSEKVVALHRALRGHGVPHAIGGAIAVDYYRVPRATIDIDLNVFVPARRADEVLAALSETVALEGIDAATAEIAEREQGKVYWGDTRIDLFFAGSPFHESMAARVRTVDYEGATLPILSAEDIVIIKAVFDRTQDWADIEAVCALGGDQLELPYIQRWLGEIVGADDSRAVRLVRLIEAAR